MPTQKRLQTKSPAVRRSISTARRTQTLRREIYTKVSVALEGQRFYSFRDRFLHPAYVNSFIGNDADDDGA